MQRSLIENKNLHEAPLKDMKQTLKGILKKTGLIDFAAKEALKLHNWSYKTASRLAKVREGHEIHPKHRIMDYHGWFLEQIEPSWKILDVGCGDGSLAFDLAQKAHSITAIDIDPKNIEKAKKIHERANIHYQVGNAVEEKFDAAFDAVTLSNVLEHIPDRVEFLKKLRPLTKRVLVRVPLIDRDWITLYKKELAVDYRLDPTHFIEYTFDEFKKETREAGLAITDFRTRYGELYAVCI